MAFLIRAEDVTGLLTMDAAIDAVESGFREFGRSPELNAPRRRITTPEGVRVSVHPGGVPSLGGIGVLAHAEHVAVSKEVQTYHNMGGPVTVLVRCERRFAHGHYRRQNRCGRDRGGAADTDAHGCDERGGHSRSGAH